MRPITVVVTASGAPGTAALVHALRRNGERDVRVVGTDMSERSVGRHLCDAFHLVPAGSDPAFADAVLAVAERERADEGGGARRSRRGHHDRDRPQSLPRAVRSSRSFPPG